MYAPHKTQKPHHRPVSWKPPNVKINTQTASVLQYQPVCERARVCVFFTVIERHHLFISFPYLCQAMNVRSTASVYTFQVTRMYTECAQQWIHACRTPGHTLNGAASGTTTGRVISMELAGWNTHSLIHSLTGRNALYLCNMSEPKDIPPPPPLSQIEIKRHSSSLLAPLRSFLDLFHPA
jgi:hypothetical protein